MLLGHGEIECLQRLVVEGTIQNQNARSINSRYTDVFPTSEGPAPIPFRTQAPIKLEYVVALARQIIEAMQIRHDKIATGRLPMVCDMGTL